MEDSVSIYHIEINLNEVVMIAIPTVGTEQKIHCQKTIYKDDAKIGCFRIKAGIPDCKRIPFRTDKELILPSGKFVTYCMLTELQACEGGDLLQDS